MLKGECMSLKWNIVWKLLSQLLKKINNHLDLGKGVLKFDKVPLKWAHIIATDVITPVQYILWFLSPPEFWYMFHFKTCTRTVPFNLVKKISLEGNYKFLNFRCLIFFCNIYFTIVLCICDILVSDAQWTLPPEIFNNSTNLSWSF